MPPCRGPDKLCHCHHQKMPWRFFACGLWGSQSRMWLTSRIRRGAFTQFTAFTPHESQGSAVLRSPNEDQRSVLQIKCVVCSWDLSRFIQIFKRFQDDTPEISSTSKLSKLVLNRMEPGAPWWGGAALESTLLWLGRASTTGCWSLRSDARTGTEFQWAL